MSSHFVVPNWRNLNHQKQLQEQIKEEEEVEETAPQGEGGGGGGRGGSQRNRSSFSSSSNHFHTQPFTTTPSFPIMSSNYEVAELTWENGQLAMHGLGDGGGLLPSDPAPKPLWTRVGAGADTLESIVHQAATSCPNPNTNPNLDHQKIQSNNHPINMDSLFASSSEKWTDQNTCQMGPKPMKKRSRSESVPVRRNSSASDFPRRLDGSACASATFFGDTDTNMMTVTSSEYSPCSLKGKHTDEDSAFHDSRRVNQDEECDTKTETGRSHSSRRIRVAAVHNQSERKRRDRINQKMKALQKLVPNSSKTDKASMLDEVIGYLKQLQTQIQMIQSVGNTMPSPHQMLMPSTAMGIQQQQQQQQQQQLQQMSLLARMAAAGMGLGGIGAMGMLDMNSMASSTFPSLLAQPTRPAIPTTTTPAFVPSPFLVPQMMQARMNMPVPGSSNNILNPSLPMPNPYSALLQQSMNMDLYNKMAAFYGQQLKQTTQETMMSTNSSQAKHIHNRD